MIVKVLCHFPKKDLMFGTNNIQGVNQVHPLESTQAARTYDSNKMSLTSPGKNHSYAIGDTIQVAWDAANIVGNVEIHIKNNFNDPALGTLIYAAPEDSPQSLVIPEITTGGDYYVQVYGYDAQSVKCWSDSYNFNIIPVGNWENRIISISALNRNIGDDKSYEVSGISIEFNDTDRYFREMMTSSDRYIAGSKVELFTEEDILIYTGTVEKWQFSEDAFVLSINDKLSGLETLLPGSITLDAFPAAPEDADGESIPIIYGSLYEEKGAVKCWKAKDTDLFLLARHHCKDLMGTTVFEEDGTGITGAALINDETDGYAYIQCSGAESFIFANVYGAVDGDDNLIDDPIDVLKHMIANFTTMSYNEEAMDTAQALMQERGYKITSIIDEQKNFNDFIVTFCFSFDCDFHIGKGNEIVITLLNRTTLTPVKSFTSHQIVDFKMDELPEDIRNKVKYQYKYNYVDDKYNKAPVYSKDSSIANWGEFYNRNETLDLQYVIDDLSAFDVVQRYVIQRKNPSRVAQMDIPLSVFSGVELADIIEVQHPSAIDDNKRKYQVRRIDVNFNEDIVQTEAVDISTLTGGMLVLGDSTELPEEWTGTSDGNVHRDFGYLADGDTGYFSNGTDYGKVLY
jgi:hypothetical protein